MVLTRRQFVPEVAEVERSRLKDRLHRLNGFAEWVEQTGRSFEKPDLAIYQAFLEQQRDLAPSSIHAHISTVCGRYRELSDDQLVLQNWQGRRCLRTKAGEVQVYLPNNLRFTRPEGDYLRLELAHILTLLSQPDTSTLTGLRDRAMIAMMVLTGLRGREVCALRVEDLRVLIGDRLFVHVSEGQGSQERYVPYGDTHETLVWTEEWMEAAQIRDGWVYRRIYKNNSVHQRGLSVRSLELMLTTYPIEVEGQLVEIKSLDLRRAYAARLYNIGVPLGNIQAHLGIHDLNAVAKYVGDVNTPPAQNSLVHWYDLPPNDAEKGILMP